MRKGGYLSPVWLPATDIHPGDLVRHDSKWREVNGVEVMPGGHRLRCDDPPLFLLAPHTLYLRVKKQRTFITA